MRRTISKFTVISTAALAAAPAWAHPVHVDELAGHSHWLGFTGLAAAAFGVGVFFYLNRKRSADKRTGETVRAKGRAA